jgi:hypothetical protein
MSTPFITVTKKNLNKIRSNLDGHFYRRFSADQDPQPDKPFLPPVAGRFMVSSAVGASGTGACQNNKTSYLLTAPKLPIRLQKRPSPL